MSGSGKICILVPDWSRFKSLEPNAVDVTGKMGPLYFNMKPIFKSWNLGKKFGFKNIADLNWGIVPKLLLQTSSSGLFLIMIKK